MSKALAITARKLMARSTTVHQTEGRNIYEVVLTTALDAVSVLRGAQDMYWVGGGTYQKDVFTYVYGSLHAAALMMKEVPSKSSTLDISSSVSGIVSGSVSISGSGSNDLGVVLKGALSDFKGEVHPWIQDTIKKLSC